MNPVMLARIEEAKAAERARKQAQKTKGGGAAPSGGLARLNLGIVAKKEEGGKTADAKKVEKYLQDMLGVNVTEVKMEQSREVGRKKNLMEQIGSQSSDNDSIAAARAKTRAAGKAGGSEEGQKFTERL